MPPWSGKREMVFRPMVHIIGVIRRCSHLAIFQLESLVCCHVMGVFNVVSFPFFELENVFQVHNLMDNITI